MNTKDRMEHWEMSRRLREEYARSRLDELLNFAFDPKVLQFPDAHLLGDLFTGLVGLFEPDWEIDQPEPHAMRAQITKAVEELQSYARAIATTGWYPRASAHHLSVRVSVADASADRDGRPRIMFRGTLADAIIWAGLKLFSEVRRSLVRECGFEGCSRVYVATKNQKFCRDHQGEARRQMQRRAEHAFRKRAEDKKKKKK